MEYLNAKQVIGKLKQGGTCSITESYFSQLVKRGVVPFYTVPGRRRKMYIYAEAKKAVLEAQDPAYDARREEKTKAASNEEEMPLTPEEIDYLNHSLPKDMPNELRQLLKDVVDPLKRVKISKEFWASKRQEISYQLESGDVIPLSDAQAVIEMILTPFNTKLDDLPVSLKSRFTTVPTEAIDWLSFYINDMKIEAQSMTTKTTKKENDV